MPTNQIYKPNRNLSKVREVGVDVPQGSPVLIDDRPGVTDGLSGGSTRTDDRIAGVSVTYANQGNVGFEEGEALVHRDGTFEFPVDGVDEDTDVDTDVFLTSAGALTLTSAGNTYFGKVDYPTDYERKVGRAPVQIGVSQ